MAQHLFQSRILSQLREVLQILRKADQSGQQSIRFDFDKANIKPEYRDILNRIAEL